MCIFFQLKHIASKEGKYTFFFLKCVQRIVDTFLFFLPEIDEISNKCMFQGNIGAKWFFSLMFLRKRWCLGIFDEGYGLIQIKVSKGESTYLITKAIFDELCQERRTGDSRFSEYLHLVSEESHTSICFSSRQQWYLAAVPVQKHLGCWFVSWLLNVLEAPALENSEILEACRMQRNDWSSKTKCKL